LSYVRHVRVAFAALFFAARADADDLPLTYDAPAACSSAEAFAAEVRARAPIASTPAPRQSFEVQITRGATWIGRLAIADDEEPMTREFRGTDCQEVTRALALAIATALEPAAPPPAQAIEPSPPPADAPRTIRPAHDLAVGGAMGATGGLAPELAPEVAVFGEAGWNARAVRLGVAIALGPAIPIAQGHAVLRRALFRAEGCPLAFGGAVVRTSLCAALDAGPVFASGVDVESGESRTRIWLAAGALARARWVFAAPLFAEIEARTTIPLLRDRYFSRPDTTIYEIPVVTTAGAAAVGVRFQ
jgi:hypothetical protein